MTDHKPDPIKKDPKRDAMSRRQFLKGLGLGAGVLAVGMSPLASAIATAAAEGQRKSVLGTYKQFEAANNGRSIWYAQPPAKKRFAMVIDTKACIGCRRCVYACVKENNIGRDSGFTYIQLMEMELGSLELEKGTLNYKEGGNPDRWYLPIQCMQCDHPPCVYGCPVQATWKEPDGIVVIDYRKCIACRNCMVACPYGARHFNWKEPAVPKSEINPLVPLEEKAGVVEKCTFCIHRTREGMETRCTEACPVRARKFGDLNDPNSDVSILLRTRRVWRLKEELGTEPLIWYVG